MPAQVTHATDKKTTVARSACFHSAITEALVWVCVILVFNFSAADAAERSNVSVETALRAAIYDTRDMIRGAHEPSIEDFYSARKFNPTWLGDQQFAELRTLASIAEQHGLLRENYGEALLQQQLEIATHSSGFMQWARLDVLATRAVAALLCDLRYGRSAPELSSSRRSTALRPTERCSATDFDNFASTKDLGQLASSAAPESALYKRLITTLAEFRAGNNQPAEVIISRGRAIEPGARNERITQLRARLEVWPTFDDAYSLDLYDPILVEAVKDYQYAHQLPTDGVIGRKTIDALNISIDDRIEQIRVNLEWERWGTSDRPTDYLVINIPHYKARLFENGSLAWTARAQVGRSQRQTPVLKTHITTVIANPTWTVPPTIMARDVLPNVRRNQGYLKKKGLRVVDLKGRTIDANSIDWQNVSSRSFPYRLRARPGPGNALGRLKFLMPNSQLIFIHDTPSKEKFDSHTRLFSSGCIRIENPDQLAERLMAMQEEDNHGVLQTALASKRTKGLKLMRKIPVIVTYNTIELDSNDRLIFGADVYGRDVRVLQALNTSVKDTNQRLAQLNQPPITAL